MKTSLLTTLSFLLLLSCTKFLLARSASHEPVLDRDNNTVSSKLQYIIKLAGSTNVLSSRNGITDPRPFYVVQEPSIEKASLTFFIPIDGSTTVTESTNLIVAYKDRIVYRGDKKSIWKVNETGVCPRLWPIFVGDFDEKTYGTWFKLERVGITAGVVVYKFVFCSVPKSVCYNIAVSFGPEVYGLVVDTCNTLPVLHFVLIPATSEGIKLVTSH